MKIIGLDLSLTSTGIAVFVDGKIYSTSIGYKGKSSDTYMDQSARIEVIADFVEHYVDGADLVVVEGPAYDAVSTSVWERAGLFYRVLAMLTPGKVVVAAPYTVKQWAAGAGGATKKAVKDAVVNLYPDFEPTNFDESDAAAMALLGAHKIGAIDLPGRARLKAVNTTQII